MSEKNKQEDQFAPRGNLERVLDKFFGLMRSERDKRIMEEVQNAQGDIQVVGIDTIVRNSDNSGNDSANKAQLAKRQKIADGLVRSQSQ